MCRSLAVVRLVVQ